MEGGRAHGRNRGFADAFLPAGQCGIYMRLWNDRDNSRIMHIVMRDTAAGGYRERILLSYPLDLMSPYY
jgi:hypothetical protein